MDLALPKGQRIAVVGTGIAGLSAAWLLSKGHDVTVYERDGRIGGHSNTVSVPGRPGPISVDTGFIVYNEIAYPNLTCLFRILDVPTQSSDMSFSVSLDGGALEYSGGSLSGLFAQRRNVFRPRFWSMLRDLNRFYRTAPADLPSLDDDTTLGDYLSAKKYGPAFCDEHLMPMASAIWSVPPQAVYGYAAASFIRFYENHGLLRLHGRPVWRTVCGGSRTYVERMARGLLIRLGTPVASIERRGGGVIVRDDAGHIDHFDHVVIATHADQALALLADAAPDERRLLGSFSYSRNRAFLHQDDGFMPSRRAVWSSWNYIRESGANDSGVMVSYWMNRLQRLTTARPLFVTLNPPRSPRNESILRTEAYDHPVLDAAALRAQRELWRLQGGRNTWFCGSYFGAGFHEDALQSGLWTAEQLGGGRRPWIVENPSSRIVTGPVESVPVKGERVA